MNTKRKSNSVVTVQQFDNSLQFDVIGADSIVLNMDKLHPDVLKRAAFHGMKQRIADAAAMSRNPETGQPATPEEKYEAMRALVEHYHSGTAEWSRRGLSGSGAGVQSITLLAIARVKSVEYADAVAMVERLAARRTDGDRAEALRLLAKAADVQKAMLEIKAERLAAKGDETEAEALLDELTGE